MRYFNPITMRYEDDKDYSTKTPKNTIYTGNLAFFNTCPDVDTMIREAKEMDREQRERERYEAMIRWADRWTKGQDGIIDAGFMTGFR